MDTGCLGGGLDLGAGSARHAVGDVFRDGAAARQPAVLQDDGQATPEAVPGVLLDGQPVNGDRAALGCIESQQEGDQGGLAGPGGPPPRPPCCRRGCPALKSRSTGWAGS